MKPGVTIKPSTKGIIQVITIYLLIVAIITLVPGTTFAADEITGKTPWSASGNITQNLDKHATTFFTFTFDGRTLTGSGTIENSGTTGPKNEPYHWKLVYTFKTESINTTYTDFTGPVIVRDENGKDTGKHTFEVYKKGNTISVGVFGYDSIDFELPIKKGAETVEESKLNIFPYKPFYRPTSKDDPRQAGDLIVQLITTGNIPIPGQLVFYYVKAGSALDNIVTTDAQLSGDLNNLWQDLQQKYNAKLVGHSYTDTNGFAGVNYIFNISDNIEGFVTKLKEGAIRGDIEVIIVNPKSYSSSQGEYKIELWRQTKFPVVIPGVAKIELIHWLGDDTEKKKKNKPNIQVDTKGNNISGPGVKTVAKNDLPYYLLPGDKILLGDNDWIKVTWLTGTRIKARPKTGQSGELNIADTGTDWWIHAVQTLKRPIVGFSISGLGALINVIGFTATTTLGSAAAAAVGVVLAVPGMYVAYKDRNNPLLLELYSNVLIDINGAAGEINIFLVEGRCIVNGVVDDSTTEMTTGQKVTIDKNADISAVSEFSLDALDEDLVSLLEDEPETPASDTTKGLVFESRNRPSGTEIQIPLVLNGIPEQVGNLDLTLTYDPSVLEAIDVIGGSLTINSIMEYNITPGNIRIALADGEGFLGDGSVVYVRFNVIGSEGQNTFLNITESIANDVNYGLIQLQNNNGVFKVIDIDETRGDFDGNGQLTAVDALSALQMAVGKRPIDLSLDMNGDGQVTSQDARTILKIAVGIN